MGLVSNPFLVLIDFALIRLIREDPRSLSLRGSIWFAAGVPRGLPVGVREPVDGVDHRGDGVGHMGEVDRAQFIAWLMVVLVQAVA